MGKNKSQDTFLELVKNIKRDSKNKPENYVKGHPLFVFMGILLSASSEDREKHFNSIEELFDLCVYFLRVYYDDFVNKKNIKYNERFPSIYYLKNISYRKKLLKYLHELSNLSGEYTGKQFDDDLDQYTREASISTIFRNSEEDIKLISNDGGNFRKLFKKNETGLFSKSPFNDDDDFFVERIAVNEKYDKTVLYTYDGDFYKINNTDTDTSNNEINQVTIIPEVNNDDDDENGTRYKLPVKCIKYSKEVSGEPSGGETVNSEEVTDIDVRNLTKNNHFVKEGVFVTVKIVEEDKVNITTVNGTDEENEQEPMLISEFITEYNVLDEESTKTLLEFLEQNPRKVVENLTNVKTLKFMK